VSQTVPFVLTAILLGALKPITLPVGLILLAHAWIIPELYAARGANVVSPRVGGAPKAEQRALLLLGDLIGHDARALYARTALVPERGELGVWLVGQAGAVLVAPDGRRVYCLCVKATDPKLPSGDRVAHLLLALRASRRSPISPSPALGGGCGGGCEHPRVKRSTTPLRLPGPAARPTGPEDVYTRGQCGL
jgi:hypothetical protein